RLTPLSISTSIGSIRLWEDSLPCLTKGNEPQKGTMKITKGTREIVLCFFGFPLCLLCTFPVLLGKVCGFFVATLQTLARDPQLDPRHLQLRPRSAPTHP